MVTVADLIKRLQELPMDHIVVLSRDEEGNGFHALADVSAEHAEMPLGYYIDLYDEGEPNVVVLWP